jgi:hypothetical protein
VGGHAQPQARGLGEQRLEQIGVDAGVDLDEVGVVDGALVHGAPCFLGRAHARGVRVGRGHGVDHPAGRVDARAQYAVRRDGLLQRE